MAHMVETIAYAGEVPWHGLGKKVPADLTPDQMLEAAGLDWKVEVRDLYSDAPNGNGDRCIIPGRKGLYRSSDNKYFDVIGEDWNPLQNHEAFEFFNGFVAEGDMEMHTAGSLDGGRHVWALAKVHDAFEVFKNDVIEQYLLFSNPHSYGKSIDVRMTPTRVVCHNTLSLALDGVSEQMVKVNHRTAFDAELVKETLGVAKEKMETYKEAAKFLGSKRFNNETLVEYFDRVFPRSSSKDVDKTKDKIEQVSRNARTALEIMDSQPGAEFGAGTWWQAFNSVTYMTDHLLGNSDNTRMKSAWFGANRKKKIDALETAVEFAEAA